MKNLIRALCLVMLIIAFGSCAKGTNENSASSIGKSTKDREGNDINVPDKIEKIVVISPSITETLVDLGFSDKIIAIDKYSVGLKGIKSGLPEFDIMQPDTEKLISLKPDVVFITGMSKAQGENPFKPLIDAGICVVCIPSSSSINAIKEDIDFIGKVMKQEDKAKTIIATMEEDIAKIKKIGDSITDKKKVYFEIASAPSMYSFGKNVFLNEMIELIGATNVLASQDGWLSVSEESVLSSNPDVILTNVDYIDNPVDEIKGRNGWEAVNAVKNNQVYFVDRNPSSLSNENIAIALKQMAKYIYPDKYTD